MKEKEIKPYEGIDVTHMITHIAKSWGKMLIAMVICAVLLGGYSYYLNAKGLAARAQAEAKETDNGVQEKEILRGEKEILEESGLSEKAADEVLYYTNKYYYNKRQYERQREYLEDSILMQMDPNNVWTITLYYDITTAENSSSTDAALASSYIAKTLTGEVYKKMANEVGAETDSNYFAEIVTSSYLDSLSNTGDVTVVSDKEDIKIVIRYLDQSGCRKIAQIVEEQIASVHSEVTKEVGTHSILLVGTQEEQKAEIDILNNQRNTISSMANISDNVVSARNNIEASEESVFQELVAYYEYRDAQKEKASESDVKEEAITVDGQEEDEKTEVSEIKPQVSKKYVALGLFLGLFFIAAYEACKYFFTHTLKQASELERAYGIDVYPATDEAIIKLVLEQKAQKDGMKNICRLSSRDNISTDEQVLQKLMKADGVLLEEKVNESSHVEIAKLLEVCRKLDKRVIGAIVED